MTINNDTFKKLKDKLSILKENRKFYKKIYSDIEIDKFETINDFINQIPIINKELVFNKENIFDLITVDNGVISPSAGTSSNNFSFRYELNSNSDDSFNRLLFSLLNLWFNISEKKTLIINAYPIGISLPKASYTLINTATRDDLICFALDYFSEKFENIILIAQPHFIKHLVDTENFNSLKFDREKLNFIIGGNWFPYTFETYILKKIYGVNFKSYYNKIKSTMGTAETGLGVLVDFKENLRVYLSQDKLDEVIPLVYQYLPDRFFIEAINDEMVLSILNTFNPELIRYNTQDKIKFPDNTAIPEQIKNHNLGNMVFLYGRGNYYLEKAKIAHNLYFDFEIAKLISGNYYLDEKQNLNIQLNFEVDSNVILKEKITSLFSTEYKVNIFEYEKYPYKKSLDRKPY
jgi:phenylacetate-coenzyme A ligase PaaK-like adenylate-forming protein